MYNSVEVAWKMLIAAHQQNLPLSHLKLQKLVYIAHGYLLAWKMKPLINDAVEAWSYGPVIPSIYHEFKQYGSSNIPIVNVDFPTNLDNDEDAKAVIKGVLDLYGNLDAITLVNLTHQPNTPWGDAWHNLGGSAVYSFQIDNESIKNHYRKVLADPANAGGL